MFPLFSERPPSEATFTGEEYLHFDVRGSGGEPLVSWSDKVSLQFRSRQSAGLLFFTADLGPHTIGSEYFLHVALEKGGIAVHTKLGSGHVEKIVRPSKVRFDDNQWHKIVIHRKVREITRATGFCHLSVTIDGVYTERGLTTGSFSMLSSSVIYVGGAAPTTAAQLLPASRIPNFVGCVRKVEFVADSVSLDLLSLAKSQSKLLRYHGDVQFFCQEMEAADPITFTTRESFLALPTWEGSKTGTIAFRFRTNEATGLLMYNGGPGDVFALELLDGHVYLVLGLGSGIAKVKASGKRCDDGQWHTVTLRRTGKTGRIAVDEAAYDFTTPDMEPSFMWKLETIGIADDAQSISRFAEDQAAKEQFLRGLRRTGDGRYCVSLPWTLKFLLIFPLTGILQKEGSLLLREN
ncbi:neurexin-1-like [Stegodyphus dumicola]|uniref:neurexin-1-like n=1 Tax=Stegodyphus dumicola TaxID=202533 RepID=UPI0015AE741E|nr:neurexin-1-like [Stegodyphus dumicola]